MALIYLGIAWPASIFLISLLDLPSSGIMQQTDSPLRAAESTMTMAFCGQLRWQVRQPLQSPMMTSLGLGTAAQHGQADEKASNLYLKLRLIARPGMNEPRGK